MKTKSDPKSESRARRKIIQFFMDNEGSIDTPRGISTWINEGLPVVLRALEDLVKSGVLKAHRTSSTVGYSSKRSKHGLSEILRQLSSST
jgi:hypothetical protein